MLSIPLTMRAAWYERTGRADEVLTIGTIDTPIPRDGEVLVAVALSGVNPHDTKRRSGWIGQELSSSRVIPGSDAAGTIARVGPGVDPKRLDQRVWVFKADQRRPDCGTAAAFVCVPAGHAVPLPDEVSFAVGAGLGVPAMTAHDAVFGDGFVTGHDVLVQGGAGAVASYAIQFARWNGARVIATVSSDEKAAYARRLGADATVDYRREDVAAAVHAFTGGKGVERIVEVDLGANLPTDAAVIAPNGVIASYSSTRVREPVLPYYDLAFKGVTLRLVQAMLFRPEHRARIARDISALLRRKALQHPPSHVFPLYAIAEAHAALECGSLIGKVLLDANAG